jgi:hypothetical protein
MNDHGVPTTLDSIGARGTDDVRALAEKYHADYVLADRSTMLTLPIAYLNDEYVVYRIKNRSTDHSK